MGHQEALDHAEGQADAQADEDHREHIPALLLQVHRADHAHEAGDGAHADVDAASDHHQAHAAGEDDEGGVVVENVQEVLGLGEAAAQEEYGGQVQEEEHHDGDGQQQVGVAHGGALPDAPLVVDCNSLRHVRTPPSRSWPAPS